MVLWSHGKIYGSIIYFKKKENQTYSIYFVKKYTCISKKKKKDGVGDKPSAWQQQLFLGGRITCDF